MKKLCAALLICVILMGLIVPASAVPMSNLDKKYISSLGVMTGQNGKPYNGVMYDANGNEMFTMPTDVMQLVVTSFTDKEKALPQIEESLTKAQKQISEAADVSELAEGIGSALSAKKAVSENEAVKNVQVSDLVVSELYDVSIVRNDTELVELEKGTQISFMLQTTLHPDDFFFILHSYGDDKWYVEEDFSLFENGILTVMCDGLSPFAIVTAPEVEMVADAAATEPDAEEPEVEETSPVTGIEFTQLYLFGFAAFAAAAVVLLKKAKEQSAF